MIKKVFSVTTEAKTTTATTTTTTATNVAGNNHFLLLPYKGEKRRHLIKSMKRRISKLLPPEIKTKVAFTGKKLSTCF